MADNAEMATEEASSLPRADEELPVVLTVDEAAAFLRVNRKTIYDAIAAGDFPARRVGRRYCILRDALVEWLRGESRVPRSRSNR